MEQPCLTPLTSLKTLGEKFLWGIVRTNKRLLGVVSPRKRTLGSVYDCLVLSRKDKVSSQQKNISVEYLKRTSKSVRA